jgi:outer membrane protein
MRKILIAVFVLALSTYAFAADSVKIGYIDMQQALNESDSGKEAKADLEKMVKARQVKIDEKIAMRDKLMAEIEKQSVVLSEDAKRQKQDELEQLGRDVERLVSDSNAELQKQPREMELEIIKDLDVILKELGEDGKYTIILPAEVILYSAEGIDITDTVIKKLNEMYKRRSKKGSGKK